MKYKDFFKNENSTIIEISSKGRAKLYVTQGKLSFDNFKKLLDIDPTEQKKYVGWMAKQWIRMNGSEDVNKDVSKDVSTDVSKDVSTDVSTDVSKVGKLTFEDLRNRIEEYDLFSNKKKVKTTDINAFKTFEDLSSEVKELNDTGEGLSDSDKENDYETIGDNNDILVICPHTHEASRKLGLTTFKYRDCGDGNKDSSWCTTYKTSDHWDFYYLKRKATFYYFLIKSDVLMKKLETAFSSKNGNGLLGKNMRVVALAVLNDGGIDGYDGLDNRMDSGTSQSNVNKFRKIVGV